MEGEAEGKMEGEIEVEVEGEMEGETEVVGAGAEQSGANLQGGRLNNVSLT